MTWLSWRLALGAVVGCLLAPITALAETSDDLVTQGQELARQGRIDDAIARFRAADAVEPRAVHSCLIGLAYLRGGALGNAEVSFAHCHQRSTAPLPVWVAKEEQDLVARLEASTLGTVTLVLDADIVSLAVPALLDGGAFPPIQRLRLPAGAHRIVGSTRDGGELVTTVVVEQRTAHEATLVAPRATAPDPVVPAGTGAGDVRPIPAPRPIPPPRSLVPKVFVIGGGAAVIAGALVHVLAVRPARVDLEAAPTGADYDAALGDYTTPRSLTIGLYAIGGAALITGAVLGWRDRRAPIVSARIGAGGATIGLVWHR